MVLSSLIHPIKFQPIEVYPGQRVILSDLKWQEFEQILINLGEKRATRIAYYGGDLEIRMPLPEHERAKVLIANILVVLLEELDLSWESLGSSTFKNQAMNAGIEPDDCFYIKNCQAIIGINRLDLTIDPPPDLAIEVDLSSRTQINAYLALGVPEIWRYDQAKFEIFLLTDGKYIESSTSLAFPNIPIIEGISMSLQSKSKMLISDVRKEFRRWVKQYI